MANILSVGHSALAAAQIGLSVTGHNIANASTPGYNRQVVLQNALHGQDGGFGFVGKGTEVAGVERVYSDILARQTMSAQTAKSQLDSYYSQISQINNMLADPTAGLSPAMQDFFKSVQVAASDPDLAGARQSLLSSAQALAARFQGLDSQLGEIRQGVNDQITTSTGIINVYASQIAQLNDAIEKATRGSGGATPNDLLDQRDQALAELSKEVKVSVVKQGGSYDVYIGNGQPLVVGTRTYQLTTVLSPTDPNRIEVAYEGSAGTVRFPDNSFGGGNLAGLFEFRASTLDQAQNALGRVAIVLASSFNAQHRLGQDQNGAPGGDFFKVAKPDVTASTFNAKPGTGGIASDAEAGKVAADIVDAGLLTTSNYRLQVTAAAVPADPLAVPPVAAAPAQYQVIRLSDGKEFTGSPASVDGVSFSLTGAAQPGDSFLVRPTANGASASGFAVAITDRTQLALAAPIRSAADAGNRGTGSISAGSVNSAAPANPDLLQPVSIRFSTPTTYEVLGTGPGLPALGLPYTPGADISHNGWTVQISGAPAEGDSFTVGPNNGSAIDNRNALALGALQTALTVEGSTSFQGAYSQLVSVIGNKTRELEVTSKAAGEFHTQARNAQQSKSGVNLDEEAANLLRYQQAYQAAGKLMQTASELFEVLLSLGVR